jgi:methylglyoxal synthase
MHVVARVQAVAAMHYSHAKNFARLPTCHIVPVATDKDAAKFLCFSLSLQKHLLTIVQNAMKKNHHAPEKNKSNCKRSDSFISLP